MATFLVTGGAGFIGSHLCDALVQRGDTVRVLDDLSTGSRDNLPSGVTLIEADVADPDAVRAAVEAVDGVLPSRRHRLGGARRHRLARHAPR